MWCNRLNSLLYCIFFFYVHRMVHHATYGITACMFACHCNNTLQILNARHSLQGMESTIVVLKRKGRQSCLRQDPPPLDLSFWSFLTFLHHGIQEVERHLLWKFHKKIRRKRWSNVRPKLVACIGFLYKVVHTIGRLRKFNRSRGI